jgi:phage shock protein E
MILKKLREVLGISSHTDYKQLIAQGAIILDVRSKGEYQSGHIKGSINIPVDQLATELHRLRDKQAPILTCCASGMRSGTACSILKAHGYGNVHNAGSWVRLLQVNK